MKTFILLPVLMILSFTACRHDQIPALTELEQSGILGRWEIYSYTVDGISDLSAYCCRFLVFSENDQTNDLKGRFEATETGSVTTGSFELDTDNLHIRFEFDNQQLQYDYLIQDSILSFGYIENGYEIDEKWVKRE